MITGKPQPDPSIVATSVDAPKRRGFSSIFLAFLSCLFIPAGVMAAMGNGYPPACYGIAAVIFVPALAYWGGRRFDRTRPAQLAIIALCAASCTVIAYRSSRLPPEEIFQHIFRMPPSGGVAELAGRKQWFDGEIWLLSFRADDATFEALQKNIALLKDDSEPPSQQAAAEKASYLSSKWFIGIGIWASIAYDYWPPHDLPAASGIFFDDVAARNTKSPSDPGYVESVNLFRDPATGRVWVAMTKN